MSTQEPVVYISTMYPGFFFRITTKRYKLRDGRLEVNAEEAKEIDEMLVKNPHIALHLKKVDKQAAENFVREQIRSKSIGGAFKGPVNSQVLMHSQAMLNERDAEFDANLSEEQKDGLIETLKAESDLVLTEQANKPITDSVAKSAEPAKSGSLKLK